MKQKSQNAILAICPACDAKPGVKCTVTRGALVGEKMGGFHPSRERAAAKLAGTSLAPRTSKQFRCPTCKQEPSQSCVIISGKDAGKVRVSHAARVKLARDVQIATGPPLPAEPDVPDVAVGTQPDSEGWNKTQPDPVPVLSDADVDRVVDELGKMHAQRVDRAQAALRLASRIISSDELLDRIADILVTYNVDVDMLGESFVDMFGEPFAKKLGKSFPK